MSENKRNAVKRFFSYYYSKIVREKGTPEYIAKGWAIGVCIGFAIPFGFQLIISIPLSFLLKGSKLGAVLGTLVTNHFTVFVIYPIQTWMGNRIAGGHLTIPEITGALASIFANQDYKTLFSLGLEIVWSFFLGGFILAAVSTPVAYYLIKAMVVRYRKLKEMRTLKKQNQNGGKSNGNGAADL